ncbi:hypothetical protein [Pseudoxanthomonas mexicana]|uniref:hypothetical protein n=1 Tax=Pseudoxanthomonas mexicana TaxID=128785 RepID=UPI0024E1F957|nr:hypothetical protein [Pseudoxanthomonas mexicana]
MNVPFLTDLFSVVCLVLVVLSLRSMERILRRHDEQLRLNTRRIWKLEGCPRGDVAEDVQ